MKTLKLTALLLILLPTLAYAKLENGMDADVVIGQPDFNSNTANIGGRSAKNLNFPTFLYSDGIRLFVGDLRNNRVLIWNTIPKVNFSPADIVLGQPDFTTAVVNNGGVSNRSLRQPAGVFFDGQKLYVSDASNNRVLIWNSLPQNNFQPADVVLGQPDFTTVSSGTTAAKMNLPTGIAVSGGRLFVAEQSNNRVSVFNQIPTSSGASADMVIGQPSFTTNSSGVGPNSMNAPYGVSIASNKLLVAELFNNRVLIWNSIPSSNIPADFVMGQPDFNSNQSRSDRNGFNRPVQIFTDGKKVYVADQSNKRVMVWSEFPKTNFQPADYVLGQPDFSIVTPGASRSLMNNTYGVFFDGRRLFTSESGNNRILIFNLADASGVELGPQFEQGKAVLGKVFNDVNGNGIQDSGKRQALSGKKSVKNTGEQNSAGSLNAERLPLIAEPGISGVKVVSDTGIYAITDEDGKYHFPFMETGQRVLKIDTDTLPEGSEVTTDNPYKIVVTKGVLTKVSFGIKLNPVIASEQSERGDLRVEIASLPPAPRNDEDIPLLKASVTQESSQLKPRLSVSAALLSPQDKEYQKLSADPQGKDPKIFFTIDCNYFLFIKRAELKIYDENQKLAKMLELPQPLPLYYELPLKDLQQILPQMRLSKPGAPVSPEAVRHNRFYYQLSIYDAKNHEDRTSVGVFQVESIR